MSNLYESMRSDLGPETQFQVDSIKLIVAGWEAALPAYLSYI